MRSQMEVMAFMERTVICRVEGSHLRRAAARLLELTLSTRRIFAYCQQWQRMSGDFEAKRFPNSTIPE